MNLMVEKVLKALQMNEFYNQKSKNKNAPMGRFVFMCLRFCLKEKNYSGLFVSVDRG